MGTEIDNAYIESLKSLKVTEIDQNIKDKCGIVYTPLHGSGNIPVRRILKEAGFNSVYVVPEQEMPDPDFPSTVKYPNPEDRDVFDLAISIAQKRILNL